MKNMESALNFSELRTLYTGSEIQLEKLLRAVADQFKDIANGCKKACLSADSKSFNKLKHTAQPFLKIIHHDLLLDELDLTHKLLQSKSSYDSSSLQVLFSKLQIAISAEITQIERKISQAEPSKGTTLQ